MEQGREAVVKAREMVGVRVKVAQAARELAVKPAAKRVNASNRAAGSGFNRTGIRENGLTRQRNKEIINEKKETSTAQGFYLQLLRIN